MVVAMFVVLGMIAWPDDDRATGKNGGRLVGDEFKCPMRCGVAWRSRNGIVRAMASGAAASLGDEPRRPAKLALVVVVVARGVGDRLCCDSGIASGRGMPRPGVSVRPWKVGSSPAWVMRRFKSD